MELLTPLIRIALTKKSTGDSQWSEAFFFLLLWTQYLQSAMKEFLQIWYKHSFGLEDELITFLVVKF